MAETKVTPAEIQTNVKFSAYRNAAYTAVATTFTAAPYDTKLFDTGSNYSTSTFTFTAPVAGFYQFNATFTMSGPVTRLFIAFFKNGAEYSRGSDLQSSVAGIQNSVYLQLAAGDTIQAQYYTSTSASIATGTMSQFSGYLVSTT